jgi:hypothetical protein
MPVSSVERLVRPVSALRQRMLEDMAIHDLSNSALPSRRANKRLWPNGIRRRREILKHSARSGETETPTWTTTLPLPEALRRKRSKRNAACKPNNLRSFETNYLRASPCTSDRILVISIGPGESVYFLAKVGVEGSNPFARSKSTN